MFEIYLSRRKEIRTNEISFEEQIITLTSAQKIYFFIYFLSYMNVLNEQENTLFPLDCPRFSIKIVHVLS